MPSKNRLSDLERDLRGIRERVQPAENKFALLTSHELARFRRVYDRSIPIPERERLAAEMYGLIEARRILGVDPAEIAKFDAGRFADLSPEQITAFVSGAKSCKTDSDF